jgi:hypothetical protein
MHILPDPDSSPAHGSAVRYQESLFWRTITGPWLGPILLVFGWAPLFVSAIVIDILEQRGIVGPHFGVGYAMGWGTAIAFPTTIIAICSMLFPLLRAVYRLLAHR